MVQASSRRVDPLCSGNGMYCDRGQPPLTVSSHVIYLVYYYDLMTAPCQYLTVQQGGSRVLFEVCRNTDDAGPG